MITLTLSLAGKRKLNVLPRFFQEGKRTTPFLLVNRALAKQLSLKGWLLELFRKKCLVHFRIKELLLLTWQDLLPEPNTAASLKNE
jgi:hypothetical protein